MTPNVYEVDTFIQINSAFTACDGAEPLDPSTVILWVCDPAGNISQVIGDALVRITPGVYAYQTLLNQIGVWTYKWQGLGTVAVTSPDTTLIVNRTVFAPPLPNQPAPAGPAPAAFAITPTIAVTGGAATPASGYDTLAAFLAVATPISTASVQTNGYHAAGDGGGAVYVPASGPAGPGKVQTAAGQWWKLGVQPLYAEMFGAVGDGDGAGHGTDNAAAFASYYSYHQAVLAAEPGAGLTLNLYAGRIYASTDDMPFLGLDRFVLDAHGAAFQNINSTSPYGVDHQAFLYGGWGYIAQVSQSMTAAKGLSALHYTSYPINTVAAGATAIVCTNPGDAANFAVGQWCMTCSQIRYIGGNPPSMRYLDYNQVASVDPASGTVTFANGTFLKHSHSATLPPLPVSGTSFTGAAQAFPVLPNWNVHQVYKDLNVLPPSAPLSTTGICYKQGRDVSVIGGSAPGICTSQNMGGVVQGVTLINANGWEIDKLNLVSHFRDCLMVGAYIGGDGSGGSTVFENCQIQAQLFAQFNVRMTGGGLNGQISTSYCEQLVIENVTGNYQGAFGYLNTAYLTVDGTTITFNATGGVNGEGRITIPLSFMNTDATTRTWFRCVFEGAQVNYLNSPSFQQTTGQFMVISQITGDSSNVYIDGFASAPMPNGTIINYPGLQGYTGAGNSGGIINGDIETIVGNRFFATLAPYSGQLIPNPSTLVQGYPVSLTVSVVKAAATAGGCFLLVNTPSGFAQAVNLKVAGERQMTPGAIVGAQTGDVIAPLGSVYAGKINWYLSNATNGGAVSFPDATNLLPIVSLAWAFSDPSRRVQRS